MYVREAHPTDGWRITFNDKVGISFAQPKDKDARVSVAKQCCDTLEITMPVLIDEMDDRVGHAYSGMPDRLYVIDRQGKVAYKGGRGPFGFKAREMEQALLMLFLDEASVAQVTPHGVPVLTQAEAWKRLPPAERGAGQPLPAWARALAASLPRTTAAMLELDYLQRTKSPLDARLRGKLRWVAARSNRCAYSETVAAADLGRAGLSKAQLRSLAGDWAELPAAERAALAFARRMTLDAAAVTDAEVSQLMGQFGNEKFVAMVLLLAYANFQDRLFLTLGLTDEEGGPRPPLDVRFVRNAKPDQAPARVLPPPLPAPLEATVADAEWLALDLDRLQKEMQAQKERQPRILVPAWDEVRKGLPAEYTRRTPLQIKWSLVCLGYQPELTLAWFAGMRAFAEEAKQDRVFEESLFWVISRTLHCFY